MWLAARLAARLYEPVYGNLPPVTDDLTNDAIETWIAEEDVLKRLEELRVEGKPEATVQHNLRILQMLSFVVARISPRHVNFEIQTAINKAIKYHEKHSEDHARVLKYIILMYRQLPRTVDYEGFDFHVERQTLSTHPIIKTVPELVKIVEESQPAGTSGGEGV